MLPRTHKPDATVGSTLLQGDEVERKTDFFDLVRCKPAWAVRNAIRKGLDPNARDANGFTPLAAAAGRSPGVIKALIKAGGDVNSRSATGCTPLMMAAALNGSPKAIDTLLRAGANVNARDESGFSPLMHACSINKSLRVIAVLVRAGGDLRARDRNERTPLMCAAMSGNTRAVSLLLDLGADVNARDTDGMTPLVHAAAEVGDATTIRRLLQAGADINLRDAKDMSALLHAAYNSSMLPFVAALASIESADVETAGRAVEFCLRGMRGDTRALGVITSLLEAGADITLRNSSGETALMLAARPQGWSESTARLREVGIALTKPYSDGETPLALLEKGTGSQAVIVALLKAGVDVHARDNEGMNALIHAVREGGCGLRTGATETLIRTGGSEHFFGLLRVPEVTEHRVRGDDRTVIRVLLDAGLDINACDNRGRTALMMAAAEGSGFNVVAALLVAGADRHLGDHEGRTALEYATRSDLRAAFGALPANHQPPPGT